MPAGVLWSLYLLVRGAAPRAGAQLNKSTLQSDSVRRGAAGPGCISLCCSTNVRCQHFDGLDDTSSRHMVSWLRVPERLRLYQVMNYRYTVVTELKPESRCYHDCD